MKDDTLSKLRQQIDELDDELLSILSKRISVIREIGEYKSSKGLPPLDAERWSALLQSRLAQAKPSGLAPEFITSIFEIIHAYTLEIEAGKAK